MIIFLSLAILLIIGVPVSFAIGLSTVIFTIIEGGAFSTSIVAQRMISGVDSFTLLALPFFILAGNIMLYGVTPRLMRFANSFLGPIKGGLSGVVVVSSAFFGAISGSGVATVASIGTVMTPEMKKQNYGNGFMASLLAGSGVLGMIIPPSMAMVVFGVSSGVSNGDMFLAGIIPGLFTSLLLFIFGLYISKKRNYGLESYHFTLKEFLVSFRYAILPMFLPIIILGGVLSGIFTPTESSVVAVVYAFILAVFVYKDLKFKDIFGVIKNSIITSSVILLIISAASPFGWILTTQRIPEMIASFLMAITSSKIVLLILISILLLILGTFMETMATIIIMTPILFPIALGIGLDPIHFGIIMMLNLAIGGVTPPLAVGLFTSSKIVGITIEETFPDVLYVVGVMILAYLFVLFIPSVSLFIPNIVS